MTSQSQAAAASPATEFRLDKSFYIESESKRAAQPQKERERERARGRSQRVKKRIEESKTDQSRLKKRRSSSRRSINQINYYRHWKRFVEIIHWSGRGREGGLNAPLFCWLRCCLLAAINKQLWLPWLPWLAWRLWRLWHLPDDW